MSQIGKPPCDEGAILHGPRVTPCSEAARRWTLVAAILGSSMAFIDGTVANVALPALQRDLDANAFEAQWVIESYALLLAALLLVGGALGDRFGHRRVFMTGVALFTAGSLLCGLSATVGQLIAARSVQGVGAALLVPGSLALISTAYPKAQRGRAIGTWSSFSGVAAAIGPLVGGYLVEHHSWIWAFLVNVPIGVVLLFLCIARVPPDSSGKRHAGPEESHASTGAVRRRSDEPHSADDAPHVANGEPHDRVDMWGAVLATCGLAGVVFAFIEAPGRGWGSMRVLAAAAIGISGLALFARVQAVSRSPMMPLSLFRSRDFTGANVLTLLLYAALGGGLFFFPLNLIQVQGLGATAAGAAMLPFIAIMFALSRWAGRLADRFGPRAPLVAGPVVAAAGFALFAVPGVGVDYGGGFLAPVCVLGLGMAITVAPLTTTVMNAVGDELAGVASGVNNALSRTAAVLAIAGFGFVMSRVFDASLGDQLAHVSAAPDVLDAVTSQRHRWAAIELPAGIDAATARALEAAIGSAFVRGFRVVMLLCAALALLSAMSAWWWIGQAKGHARPTPAAGQVRSGHRRR